eukprot:m.74720 g.74720  ORF g.74720 m.74720 type:complete len:196 (-) comp12477_c0_seq1:268-855(-)
MICPRSPDLPRCEEILNIVSQRTPIQPAIKHGPSTIAKGLSMGLLPSVRFTVGVKHGTSMGTTERPITEGPILFSLVSPGFKPVCDCYTRQQNERLACLRAPRHGPRRHLGSMLCTCSILAIWNSNLCAQLSSQGLRPCRRGNCDQGSNHTLPCLSLVAGHGRTSQGVNVLRRNNSEHNNEILLSRCKPVPRNLS